MALPTPPPGPSRTDHNTSTRLLTKMSDTSSKMLSRDVASQWVMELEVAITQTKEEIEKRIQADLPEFEQQLSSSKSVQERFQSLQSNVDRLSDTLTHPETGLVPALISTLTRHAALSQETMDAEAMHEAMSHLAHCKREMQNLAKLVQEGRLPDAVKLCHDLEKLLASSPPPLPETQVFVDMQRKFRALRDRNEEQTQNAYSRSVVVTATEILIQPSVPVRGSDTVLSLTDIISSMSSTSLASLTTTLRRDITSHYIDHLLTQPASVEQSAVNHLTGTSEVRFSVFPSPPNTEVLTSRIDNIGSVLTFLNDNLFPHIPSSLKFPISLCRPLTKAILEKLLVPSLPSSLLDLPGFLQTMQKAVDFEEEFIGNMLGDVHGEREVKAWTEGIAGHYERKRRTDLLERARLIILREDADESFRAEITVALPTQEPPQIEQQPSVAPPERAVSPEEVAWGFDDEGKDEATEDVADEWGFDNEVVPEDEPPAEAEPLSPPPPAESPKRQGKDPVGDVWDWNDEEEATLNDEDESDSSAWDDPWGDSADSSPVTKSPKAATRLERLSNKGKSSVPSPSIQSPIPVPPPPPTPAMPAQIQQPPPRPQRVADKESYLVSGRVKELMFLVEDILNEAAELSSSGILSSYSKSTSQIGYVIAPTAALSLDLFRALHPAKIGDGLVASAKDSMRYSNDCVWLSGELKSLISRQSESIPAVKDKLDECALRLGQVGEAQFEETVDEQAEKVEETLMEANGFAGTHEQYRYDECETAVNQAVQDLRRLSQLLKPILPKSKYYQAVGAVVDAALSKILNDILALPDITAAESQKLGELCRIMNSLEGIFVEDPSQPSFVVAYVPSWLKFSYLSELLEASIADITYLFEQGALVDFEIEELANLIRALFADTPLRTNTINKIMQGHPAHTS